MQKQTIAVLTVGVFLMTRAYVAETVPRMDAADDAQ